MRIFTVGHSTHEPEAFLALLEAHGVRWLGDVRAHPGSRRHPHFGSAELRHTLAEAGIAYEHLPELGGRRRPLPDSLNGGWRNDQFRGYADHMESEEFARGVARLRDGGAVMCAEAQWWRCHRRLLADWLVAGGNEVLHIGSRGELAPHPLSDFAVVEEGRVRYPSAQAALDV